MNPPPAAHTKAPTDSQPRAADGMNITNPPAQTQTQTHECEHKRQAMRLRGGGAAKRCSPRAQRRTASSDSSAASFVSNAAKAAVTASAISFAAPAR
ncbi:uncharacterized protein EV420DRAFT_1640372 [Desarmillaria tabescens]|uniref:Uncharacterized protein n=1 Tax=Armillaria tabescens TaxID=1929756 RepID=A0AA39T3M8_ARMTA|nr:uncharacterized protein EV420DRAFT_1640372 [Desarmillaria tabescens]KAK0462086.1 hypothetical protein EV420DRAFT_1640372 [Desarmillaria tabescens]